jgi:general secretion pathway protein I
MQKFKINGFTLVEVMVAMAIVALAVSSLLFSVGKQVDNSAYLREKILAQWVALNVLQEAQLKARVTEKFPDKKTSGDIKLADRQWQWEMQSSKTDDKDIMQLDVNVFSGENRNDDPAARASGYIDKYFEQKNLRTRNNDGVGLGDEQSINREDDIGNNSEDIETSPPEVDENGDPL